MTSDDRLQDRPVAENQGARARAPRGDDEHAAPMGLRILTWLGVALLAVAAFVFTVPFQTPHDTTAGYSPLGQLDSTTIVVAVLLLCTGIIVLSLRVAAGAVVRSHAQR